MHGERQRPRPEPPSFAFNKFNRFASLRMEMAAVCPLISRSALMRLFRQVYINAKHSAGQFAATPGEKAALIDGSVLLPIQAHPPSTFITACRHLLISALASASRALRAISISSGNPASAFFNQAAVLLVCYFKITT
jgi:hypothetical protein